MKTWRRSGQLAATAAFIMMSSGAAVAGTLGSDVLLAPLAPDHQSHLGIAMPPDFAPDQETWVAYELVALSTTDDDEGEVGLEQSFEGVKTPLSAFYATFDADDMQSWKSAGTIAQRLEQIAGQRKPEELKGLMGQELYSAYEAVNAGRGRVLAGRIVRRLPPPGRSDAPLMVSVEWAKAMQPLALKVTVGQGPLPAEFQKKTQDYIAYKLGYGLGIMLFGWLVMRFFRRRQSVS